MPKILIVTGVVLILVGLFWAVAGKIPFLGRLPGDIFIQKKNITVYIPLATSLLISALVSAFLWLLSKK